MHKGRYRFAIFSQLDGHFRILRLIDGVEYAHLSLLLKELRGQTRRRSPYRFMRLNSSSAYTPVRLIPRERHIAIPFDPVMKRNCRRSDARRTFSEGLPIGAHLEWTLDDEEASHEASHKPESTPSRPILHFVVVA